LVEFSLLAPLFFLILYGIIEFGSIFWVQNNMVNAARETARTVAVQNVTVTATLKSTVCPWLQGRTYNVKYEDKCGASPAVPDILATVTTDAVGASVFNYMGLFGGNLSSQVTMRRENACGASALPTVTFTCP
jgi:TadE-like protein